MQDGAGRSIIPTLIQIYADRRLKHFSYSVLLAENSEVMSGNDPRFERALFESITERLMHRKSSHLPGMGTFVVRHEPAVIQNDASHSNDEQPTDGPFTISPPTDNILFENE